MWVSEVRSTGNGLNLNTAEGRANKIPRCEWQQVKDDTTIFNLSHLRTGKAEWSRLQKTRSWVVHASGSRCLLDIKAATLSRRLDIGA